MDPAALVPSIDVDLTWRTSREGKTAVLRREAHGQGWDELGRTEGNTFRVEGLHPERPVVFAAAEVLEDGGLAPEVEWEVLRWSPPAPPAGGPSLPETPTGFAASQDGPVLHFAWGPPDPATVAMEIRVGASWEDGSLVARDLRGVTASWPWWTSGALTFWIKGQDALGRYSRVAATLSMAVQALPGHVTANTWDEADGGFPGTSEHMEVDGGVLRLERLEPFGALTEPFGSYEGLPSHARYWHEGTYTSDAHDMGAVETERLEVELEASHPVDVDLPFGAIRHQALGPCRFSDGTLVPLGTRGFASKNSWRLNPFTPPDVLVEVDTSPTATAVEGSVIWDGWRPYVPGDYKFRWVRFRVTAKGDGLRFIEIPNLVFRHRRLNKKDEGLVEVEASPGPTEVVFATPFVLAPEVHGQLLEADAGLKVVAEDVTKTGCNLRVYSREPVKVPLLFSQFSDPGGEAFVDVMDIPAGWEVERTWLHPTEEFDGPGAVNVFLALGPDGNPEGLIPDYDVGPGLTVGGDEFEEAGGRTFDFGSAVTLKARLTCPDIALSALDQGAVDVFVKLRPVSQDAMGTEVFSGSIRWYALGV